MDTCNAKVTTATVTDKVVRPPLTDGRTVKRDGDRLLRVELHTVTCHRSEGHDGSRPSDTYIGVHRGDGVEWDDDTPGATPHTPVSTVTDAEFKAAVSAFNAHLDVHRGAYNAALDGALVAAFAVRAAQEDDRD